MESAWVANPPTATASVQHALWRCLLWPSDRIAITWFVYLAALAIYRRHPALHGFLLLAFAGAIGLASLWESNNSKPWTRILREWLSLGVILPAYWSIEWFSTPLKHMSLQMLWLHWDRLLLDQWGLRGAIESMGAAIPFLLETAYLLLYTMPVVALIVLQRTGRRADRQAFLQTLFLGTFSVYAILPLVAVESPRRVFPQQDEPRILTAPRQLNVFVLDHMDISTGVFPSGHVAVGFSTAFGLLGFARRHRRSLHLPLAAFAMGTLVFVSTIYGRYHYAVDGAASILIAAAAWRVAGTQTIGSAPHEA